MKTMIAAALMAISINATMVNASTFIPYDSALAATMTPYNGTVPAYEPIPYEPSLPAYRFNPFPSLEGRVDELEDRIEELERSQ